MMTDQSRTIFCLIIGLRFLPITEGEGTISEQGLYDRGRSNSQSTLYNGHGGKEEIKHLMVGEAHLYARILLFMPEGHLECDIRMGREIVGSRFVFGDLPVFGTKRFLQRRYVD